MGYGAEARVRADRRRAEATGWDGGVGVQAHGTGALNIDGCRIGHVG